MMDDLSALMFVNGSMSPGLLGNGGVFFAGAIARRFCSLVDQWEGWLMCAPIFFFRACPTAPVPTCLTDFHRKFNQLGI